MVTENAREEEFARSGEADFTVPAELFIPVSGERGLTVFPSLSHLAGSLEKCASAEEFAACVSQADALLRSLGYSDGPVAFDNLEFVFAKDPGLPGFDNIKIGSGDCPSVSYLIGGLAVSAASVNDFSRDGAVEIYVETEEEYRGRGYATLCAAHLAAALSADGTRVTYVCGADNTASRRVAEKAGFEMTGRRLTAVYYKV